MKTKRLLDSFALLAYLKKEKGHETVKHLLATEDSALGMNDVNVGECYYIIARERGIQAADYFVNVILPSLPLSLIGNRLSEVLEAAKIKSRCAMSYADCFAVATAVRIGAVLVTGDPEFRQVEDEVDIEWI